MYIIIPEVTLIAWRLPYSFTRNVLFASLHTYFQSSAAGDPSIYARSTDVSSSPIPRAVVCFWVELNHNLEKEQQPQDHNNPSNNRLHRVLAFACEPPLSSGTLVAPGNCVRVIRKCVIWYVDVLLCCIIAGGIVRWWRVCRWVCLWVWLAGRRWHRDGGAYIMMVMVTTLVHVESLLPFNFVDGCLI